MFVIRLIMKLISELETIAPVQVVFSHGVTSTSIRSFGRQKEMTDDGSIADYSEAPATGEMQKKKEVAGSSIVKKNKEYQDPWVMIMLFLQTVERNTAVSCRLSLCF